MAHWECAIAKRTVTGAFVFSAALAYQHEQQQQKTAHTTLCKPKVGDIPYLLLGASLK